MVTKNISTLYYFRTEWLMSMIINVNEHEDEPTEWIIMYNDTMDMKWKDAMKAHGILKPLPHTHNTVKGTQSHTSYIVLFYPVILEQTNILYSCCSKLFLNTSFVFQHLTLCFQAMFVVLIKVPFIEQSEWCFYMAWHCFVKDCIKQSKNDFIDLFFLFLRAITLFTWAPRKKTLRYYPQRLCFDK